MAASIGGGGGQHVHFDGSSADAPQPKKETPKEPAKSILKQTAPVEPPTSEQVSRERMRAEFLRGALGAAPANTKQTLNAMFEMGRQQTSRLKPEMKPTAGNQAADKDPETSASS